MKKQKGFTLFELLITISIIGILTALAIVSYNGAQVRARNAKRKADMNTIQKAAELYYSIHHYYPNNEDDFTSGPDKVLEDFPRDPYQGSVYNYFGMGLSNPPQAYIAYAAMEGDDPGNDATVCPAQAGPPNNPYFAKHFYCVIGQQ